MPSRTNQNKEKDLALIKDESLQPVSTDFLNHEIRLSFEQKSKDFMTMAGYVRNQYYIENLGIPK